MYLSICFSSPLLHIRLLQASCGGTVVWWCGGVRCVAYSSCDRILLSMAFSTQYNAYPRVQNCLSSLLTCRQSPSIAINCHQLPSIAITRHHSTHAYTRRHATAP